MTKFNMIALLIGPPTFLYSMVTGSWIYFGIALPIVIILYLLDKNQLAEEDKKNSI